MQKRTLKGKMGVVNHGDEDRDGEDKGDEEVDYKEVAVMVKMRNRE